MTARHASPLEALLIDDTFDGDGEPGELLSRHTTYRIGGPARFYVCVRSLGALTKVVRACEQAGERWVVLGRGSNVLVSDDGFDGVVVSLGRDFRRCRFDEETSRFSIGAGALLSTAVQDAFHRSLSGLEFAVGTPGTIGGAVRMNAGSRDRWLSEVLVSVTTLSADGTLARRPVDEFAWGYRTSSIASDEVVVECELQGTAADPTRVRARMEEALARRRATQPLSEPSCGSVFKNPEGHSVGKIIDDAGLKGYQVGGARVSEVHANFIVNTGNATAQDVRTLMEIIQTKVFEKYGIELAPEVRLLGFE